MKFLYSCYNNHPDELKITDSPKFGSTILDQTFFPRIIDVNLGPQEHIYMDYNNISKYLNTFIPDEDTKFSFDRKPYENDIAGLIIPIQHGDFNELLHIAGELKESYQNRVSPATNEAREMVEYYRKNGGEGYEHNPKYKRYLEDAVEGSRSCFYDNFKFPIFEAFNHMPRHRDNRVPIELIHTHINEESVGKYLDYVEGAFKVWVKQNFLDKKK
jgi:hypothetical protein